jgi:hypothetical protein
MSLEKQNEILTQLGTIKRGGQSSSGEPRGWNVSGQGLGLNVVEYLTQGLERPREGRDGLRSALITAIYSGSSLSDNRAESEIRLSKARKETLLQRFLLRLQYYGMTDREYGIHEAHEETFKWVFEDSGNASVSWSNLKEWLESDNNLYWITGKAGSGKSTLMRFISQPVPSVARDIEGVSQSHEEQVSFAIPSGEETATLENTSFNEPGSPRCAQYLQSWVGSKGHLITASFYFWVAGVSEIQTSQMGLFRSLLYQLLLASPDSIPTASPNRWEALSLFNEDPRDFTEEELREMLYRAVGHVTKNAKVVLFIDGLDEFNGDPKELISLLHRLTSNFSIKLCVASRPWINFEDAFRSRPSLKLEDLTRSDIQSYVTAKFQENANFAQLQVRQAQTADRLINSIVKKASGVFLWVRLVVASLVAGLGYGDRAEDLEKRLAQLPPELGMLYERMLDSIDSFYLEHASQYFQLIRSCQEPPSLLFFSFADETAFTDVAVSIEPRNMLDEDISHRLDDMRRRLNSRCKGLLEINRPVEADSDDYTEGGIVQYLHKTVKDYIELPEVQTKLNSHLKTSYDAQVRLLAASLAIGRVRIHMDTSKRRRDLHAPPVLDMPTCMAYASQCRQGSKEDVVRLLETLRELADSTSGIEYRLKTSIRAASETSPNAYFLCYAVEHMVVEYVKAKASWGCVVTNPGVVISRSRQGLFHSWIGKIRRLPKTPSLSLLSIMDLDHPFSATMLHTMLNKGLDPNLRQEINVRDGSTCPTPWQIALARAILAFHVDSEERTSRVSECIQLMVDNGADTGRATVYRAYELLRTGAIETTEEFPPAYEEHGRWIRENVYRTLQRVKADKRWSFTMASG